MALSGKHSPPNVHSYQRQPSAKETNPVTSGSELQPGNTFRARRFVILLALVLLAIGVWIYLAILRSGGSPNLLQWLSVPLFVILFGWISYSFAMATLGLIHSLKGRSDTGTGRAGDFPAPPDSVRTAILVPVYNESPEDVFAAVDAMNQSMVRTGRHANFDFFILSDTTNPEVWLREEELWRHICRNDPEHAAAEDRCRVFYRHRSQNKSRKSGNIAEFCELWGDGYEFMVVLDADSLMEGETITTMVDRISANPKLGILQVPPVPIGRQSFFARIQQFSADVYGPVYAAGFAAFTGAQGNYFGHNAVIRVDAFKKFCHLPVLAGAAPLGGEILSHDFVEAALMLKNGYEVIVATDLGGSFEECPTTVTDFAKRDQRWCQGNLQHSKLLVSQGFHPLSRMHFTTGLLSYVGSPIWIAFMALTLVAIAMRGDTLVDDGSATGLALGLFIASMLMLLSPKFYALFLNLIDADRRRQLGGGVRLTLSVLLETAVSVLIAPVFAIYHSSFVISTLIGKSVQWKAQQRDERGVSFADATRDLWWITGIGILSTAAVWFFTPAHLAWYMLFAIGLWLAIPMTVLTASSAIGKWLQARGLLLTDSETRQLPIVKLRDSSLREIMQANTATGPTPPDFPSRFERIFYDDDRMQLHFRMLYLTNNERPLTDAAKPYVDRLLRQDVRLDQVPVKERFSILTNPDSMTAIAESIARNARIDR